MAPGVKMGRVSPKYHVAKRSRRSAEAAGKALASALKMAPCQPGHDRIARRLVVVGKRVELLCQALSNGDTGVAKQVSVWAAKLVQFPDR